jgi:Holliday junction resolvase-like predicted endonuclease
MSTSPRIDLLGLAELDSQLAPESRFGEIDLPSTRSARIESRRAFVEMKQLFMRAVENLEHRKGAWLRAQVRAAEDPIDLWLLRGPLLATLREDDVATRTMRAALYRTLDRTFPEAFGSAEISVLSAVRP